MPRTRVSVNDKIRDAHTGSPSFGVTNDMYMSHNCELQRNVLEILVDHKLKIYVNNAAFKNLHTLFLCVFSCHCSNFSLFHLLKTLFPVIKDGCR